MKAPRTLSVLGLILNLFNLIACASKKAHAKIDRYYDQMTEDQVPQIPQESENVLVEVVSSAPGLIYNVPDFVLVHIVSYVENPLQMAWTCKLLFNVVASLSGYKIFSRKLHLDVTQFNPQIDPDSSMSLTMVLKAFGNRELVLDRRFLAKNLELALCSPAFREAFDFFLWKQLSGVDFFSQLSESILMDSQDLALHKPVNPALEAHRRTLISVLASLPLEQAGLLHFFHNFPIVFLNQATDNCFQKHLNSISERIVLLPESILISQVLPSFLFDSKLMECICRIYLKRQMHTQLLALLEHSIPEAFKSAGKVYLGCVPANTFVREAESFLNRFDPILTPIIVQLARNHPLLTSRFLSVLAGHYQPHLSQSELFHVAVLKSQLIDLEHQFDDYDFSYEKGDSEFMTCLIENDPNYATFLINRLPRSASHKAFLLNSQFQGRHFSTFKNLKEARIELKRTISCPEITRAHITYILDAQDRLFSLLLADSAERISAYFEKRLTGLDRKKYKEHPSFTIALTTLNVFFENRLARRRQRQIPEVDPEIIFKQMLMDLNALPAKPEDYFELAHEIPAFAEALLAGGLDEEDTLAIPEAATTQNLLEFELLAQSIALSRVIHDGSSINYRLVLQWFSQFGERLAGRIIPIDDLRALLKGAAFHTTRSTDKQKLRFELENELRNEPFSMTYRYALIIVVTQCKGVRSEVKRRIKNLFPGGDLNQTGQFNDLLEAACRHYHTHAAFFAQFKYVATNSRAERFLLDFIHHFIQISGLAGSPVEEVISRFFEFIRLNPFTETLLTNHFIYFILLASFKHQL